MRRDGQKILLSIRHMGGESTAAWRQFLDDLDARGLRRPAFVIVDGAVRVVRDGDELAALGSGDFFGEMSVIDGLPRVAMVVTSAPTRCLALASWEFERLVLDHPRIGLAILRGLSARLRAKTEPPLH